MTEGLPPIAWLRGVVAGYLEGRVLDGVDLELATGEMVALIGPNGSGKTTLLRVLAGTLAPSAGSIDLFGRPIEAWSRREVARRVAVLPQASDVPHGMSVAEVVALGRIPHGRSLFAAEPSDEVVVAAALRDVGAHALADRPATQLSGGERQRVMLALALAQEPELLLLDEPTLHLDLAHQLALVALLGRLRSRRRLTVVAVLHDLNLATSFADRALVMHDGRLEAAGTRAAPMTAGAAARAFGVPIEEATTAAGRRVLVPVLDPGLIRAWLRCSTPQHRLNLPITPALFTETGQPAGRRLSASRIASCCSTDAAAQGPPGHLLPFRDCDRRKEVDRQI